MNIICLTIIAEADSEAQVLQLTELVNGLTMEKKALIVIMQDLNWETLQNLTLNFEVTIDHKNKGRVNFLMSMLLVYLISHHKTQLITTQVSVPTPLSAQLWGKGMLRSMMAGAP